MWLDMQPTQPVNILTAVYDHYLSSWLSSKFASITDPVTIGLMITFDAGL
jgi:hypothetical protein